MLTLCATITIDASCTFSFNSLRSAASVFISSAEKLSSNTSTFAFFAIALAIARRCFCPPDTLLPPWAIGLSYFSFFVSINSVAWAISAASFISSSVASAFPNRRLEAIVPEKRTPFCGTNPISSRSSSIEIRRISLPSNVICPPVTS